MPTRPAAAVLAIALAMLLLTPNEAPAESALRLDLPQSFGVVDASTYDADRQKVGAAHLSIERLDDGNVRLFSESGFTGGARTVLSSVLQPVEEGQRLKPLLQESRSFDPEGTPLGVLAIDHQQRLARCFGPAGEQTAELKLPEQDRVANVTLHLLLLPLVRGETDDLSFQIFFCGLGTRVVNFSANLAPASRNGHPKQTIEVRYGPDFGIASLVAKSFVPKLSFWYDPAAPHRWMAHRVPLYGNGPEVFVVRDGVPVRWLSDE